MLNKIMLIGNLGKDPDMSYTRGNGLSPSSASRSIDAQRIATPASARRDDLVQRRPR